MTQREVSDIAKQLAPVVAMVAANAIVGGLLSHSSLAVLLVWFIVWCPVTGIASGYAGYRWAHTRRRSIWDRRPQG